MPKMLGILDTDIFVLLYYLSNQIHKRKEIYKIFHIPPLQTGKVESLTLLLATFRDRVKLRGFQ